MYTNKRKKPVRRPRTYLPVRNLVLRTLAAGGALSLALLAPKAIALLKHADRGAVRRKELYTRIKRSVGNMERAGLVRTAGPGNHIISLTQKGKILIERLYAEEYRIPEPAFWDGKWRMVIFDMHEKRRGARNRLRFLLQSAGFVRLQDSVWIFPYPCDEFIQLLRAHLKSGTGEMLVITAEALESDRKLREHFNLA